MDCFSIVTKNGKIVWKHGPNRPFFLVTWVPKIIRTQSTKPAWNINKKLRETTNQFKVKWLSWLSPCFVLNLRTSGESCLIFNWHNPRAASGISFFTREPTKDEKYSINWRNNIVAVITPYLWYHGDEGNLKKQIKNGTFWVELSSRKKLSVIRKLFLLSFIFHYISNCLKITGVMPYVLP